MSKRKNVINLLVGIMIGCIITTSATVYGADNFQSIKVVFNKVNLTVNGQQIATPNLLYDGTTYVPIRAVANALGKNVGWDNQTNTASINDASYVTPIITPTNEGSNMSTTFTEEQYQDFVNMFKYDSEYDNDAGIHVVFYDYVGDLTLDGLYRKINIQNMPYRNEMLKRFYEENKPSSYDKVGIQFLGNKFDKFIGGIMFKDNDYTIEFPGCDNSKYANK